jgi:hypothetical protein
MCLLATSLTLGCRGPNNPSLITVPLEWRTSHPWGPQANELRAAGELPVLHYTQGMAEDAAWAIDHLQEGDLIFRYGKPSSAWDRLTSHVIAVASASCFCHMAIVHFQDGKAWVFDAENEGIRLIPFEIWSLESVEGTLAVKRLRPEYRDHIPGAIAFCECAYHRDVQFDHLLRLSDDELYCSEMIEKAFRSTALSLTDPVPLRCFPRYRRFHWVEPIAKRLTGINPDEPVFAVGNDCFGVYGSPKLQLVCEGPRASRSHRRDRPPTCPPVKSD